MRSLSFARAVPPLVLLSALAAFAGCSDDDATVGDTTLLDGGVDSGRSPVDAGGLVDRVVADNDVPPAPVDAGHDAADAADTGEDAADAGPDADAAPPDPTSTDGIQNGTETDVDCGGTTPTNAPKCGLALRCGSDDDCAVGTCDATAKRCATAGRLYASYYTGNLTPKAVASYASASTCTGDSTPTATYAAVPGAGPIAIDPTHDVLYVGSYDDGSIAVTDNASTSSSIPTRKITGLSVAVGLAVDGDADRLFVAADNGLFIYDNASTLDGAQTATRKITAYPTSAQPRGLAYDREHDRLFVTLAGLGVIDVYDNASTADGTRQATVSRTIGGSAYNLDNPYQIAYDWVRDQLYVTNTYGINQDQIVVFANASTANGNIAPTRKFGFAGLDAAGIAIDVARDELYFGSSKWFKITVVPNASTQPSAAIDTSTLRTFTGFQQFVSQLALDPTRP